MVDATERLKVLLRQEATIYKTSDYLARVVQRGSHQMDADATVPNDENQSPPCSSNKKRKSLVHEDEISHRNPAMQQCGALSGGSAADISSSSLMNKQWREKICEWAYQVVDHFDLNREVVSIAMNHLDRYLAACPTTVDKNLFQLLAMTCLYLSIKLNEYKHLLIPGARSSMDSILQLSRGVFTLEQMQKMEYDILQRLQWHVHPPTPQLFVKHFLFFLAIEDHEVHDLAQFMVELSVMDYFFVSYKPSEIAIAGILNAFNRLKPQGFFSPNFPFQNTLFDVDSPEISSCRERLSLIFTQANDQASNDVTDASKGNTIHRTDSPVSVATTSPQVYQGGFQRAPGNMSEVDMDEDL